MNQIRSKVGGSSATSINSRSMFYVTSSDSNSLEANDEFDCHKKNHVAFGKFEECIYGDDWSSSSSDDETNKTNFGKHFIFYIIYIFFFVNLHYFKKYVRANIKFK